MSYEVPGGGSVYEDRSTHYGAQEHPYNPIQPIQHETGPIQRANYLGNVTRTYSFTPTVTGTYRQTCLIHPTKTGQTLRVRG